MSKLPSYEHVVQYYETDKMGIVHHSNYIRWFEEARVFVFDSIGAGYRECEQNGIISPVVEVSAKYKTSAEFYDTVVIDMKFVKYTGVRLCIEYAVTDKKTGVLRCEGKSEHCFADGDGKIISVAKTAPHIDAVLREYTEV